MSRPRGGVALAAGMAAAVLAGLVSPSSAAAQGIRVDGGYVVDAGDLGGGGISYSAHIFFPFFGPWSLGFEYGRNRLGSVSDTTMVGNAVDIRTDADYTSAALRLKLPVSTGPFVTAAYGRYSVDVRTEIFANPEGTGDPAQIMEESDSNWGWAFEAGLAELLTAGAVGVGVAVRWNRPEPGEGLEFWTVSATLTLR